MDIKITFPGGKRVNAEYNDMVIETDQSVKNGGGGSAPEPFMYFLSSIGTCAGIYVLGFCQKRDIPTHGISLTQRMEFTEEAPKKTRLSKISIDIIVPPDFPEKYHDALVKVANQCAVKKAIISPPDFEIKTIVI